MVINGITQFNQLIKSAGLSNSTPTVSSFCSCMDEYARLCNCDDEEFKKSKLNRCQTLYVHSVQSLPPIKNEIFKKVVNECIIFYNKGKHLKTLNR